MEDLQLAEVYEAAQLVKEVVDPSANIIFGTASDDSLADEVIVTVIATGFGKSLEQPAPVVSNVVPKAAPKTEEVKPVVKPSVEEIPSTTVQMDNDPSIPAFLRRLKNK